jgi:hypothetical protein
VPAVPQGLPSAHASHTASHARAAAGASPEHSPPAAAPHATLRVCRPAAFARPPAALHCAEHGPHGPTLQRLVLQSCGLHVRSAATPRSARVPQAAVSWSSECAPPAAAPAGL